MAKVHDPTLFSTYFSIECEKLEAAGLIDPFMDVDIPLFIDPVLLEKSSIEQINKQGIEGFRTHFQDFVRLLAISNQGCGLEGSPPTA